MPRTVTEEEPDYEGDLKIDPDALDVEWLEQPMTFMRWSEKAADARACADRAKNKQDVVQAEIASDVRSNPQKYGLEKVTEAAIQAAVLQSDEYQNALQNTITFRHELDVLTSAVRAFDQRKTALENLVRLQGQNYFAGPQAPRDLGQEYGKRETQRRVAVERVKQRREERKK